MFCSLGIRADYIFQLPTLSASAPSDQKAPVPEGLKDRDYLHFIDGTKAEVHADELTQVGDILGRGAYGYVTVNLYKPTNLRFAIKHIRLQDDPNVSTKIDRLHVSN